MKKLLTYIFLCIALAGSAQTFPNVMQIKAIENIAALQATRPNTDGTWAVVGGFSDYGDGGGGMFWWDATSTATENIGLVVAASGVATGRWVRDRSNSRTILPEWFGVFPNSGGDEYDGIQQMLDAAEQGGNIQFPIGVYNVSKTLNLPAITNTYSMPLSIGGTGGFTITSGNLGKTILHYTGAPGTALLDINTGSAKQGLGLTIHDIAFEGLGSASEQIGVLADDLRTVTFRNVLFQDFERGVYKPSISETYAYYSIFDECIFQTCTYGVLAIGNINQSSFTRCRFRLCNYGFYGQYGDTGPVFTECWVEGNGVGLKTVDTPGFSAQNCYFENNKTYHIDMGFGAASTTIYARFARGSVRDCNFKTEDCVTPINIVSAGASASSSAVVTIAGCFFENSAIDTTNIIWTSGSSIYQPASVLLVGNKYRYPDKMKLDYTGAFSTGSIISRLSDGAAAAWVLPSVNWYPEIASGGIGALRFDLQTEKFQGLASTTVGWVDLN